MKASRIWLGLSILALAMPASTQASLVSTNLLTNPGFEDPGPPPTNNHVAVDWIALNFATASSAVDSSNPRSGSNAILHSGVTSTTGLSAAIQQYGDDDGNVNPNEIYELSFWVKAAALPIASDDVHGGVKIWIRFSETDGRAIESSPEDPDSMFSVQGIGDLLTTSYQKFSVTGIAPPGAAELNAVLVTRHVDQSIFFDDATLELIGFVPEPTTGTFALIGCLILRTFGRCRKR